MVGPGPRPAETGAWLEEHRGELVGLVRELVSFRSENRPPHGEEGPCQAFVARYLADLGLRPDVFRPDEVDEIGRAHV